MHGEPVGQLALGAPIELRHEVDAALALGSVNAAVAFAQNGARFPGEIGGDVAKLAGCGGAHAPRAALWGQKREYGQ